MELKTSTRDGITVIEISGSLDGNTAPKAQEEIMPHAVSGCRLVLDLAKCNYISSAGLRVLLMIAKHLSAQEGQYALACVSEEIKDVMDMTGFSSFFKTYDSVPKAIDAVKA